MAVPSANGRKLQGEEDVRSVVVNGGDDMGFNPSDPPPFRVAEIRAAIPKHCWVKNPWRSFAYVLRDILVISSLVAMAVYLRNLTWAFWPPYWAAQGTMFWAIFVLGHDWYNVLIFSINYNKYTFILIIGFRSYRCNVLIAKYLMVVSDIGFL